MPFPGKNYAPPGPYTQTKFENPLGQALESLKIPVIIGEGNESLFQEDLEIVRGSSAVIDQRVVNEDQTGRAIASTSAAGLVTLGAWDGVLDRFQVVNRPIVTGDGTGTSTTSRGDVLVTINNQPVVVLAVDGTNGIIQIAANPLPTDVVRCTYYFNRSDTLVTDDVSSQVPAESATVRAASGIADVDAPNAGVVVIDMHGDILSDEGAVIVPANNVLSVTVDGVVRSITIPVKSDYTMAQIAAAITSAEIGSLTGSTFADNFGHSALMLLADHSVAVGDGSANGDLGLISGLADNRVSTFYTMNGPIVDGSGGGVVTTDPAHVTVRVDGVQVIPVSVDGATRAVTLAEAPIAAATVSIQYYWNTWQDTFDYLAHIGVTSVTRCGDVPGSSAYVQDADFVLQNDRIVWGTAALTSAGLTTAGATLFDETQITNTLVDNRNFLGECTAVATSAGGVSTDSRTQYQLPFTPTLGNGRDTPLGQSLFQTISNSRIDLPVNRPDVIWAYWGYDEQDAMARGRVTVTQVEGTVITLATAIPPGATVYATQYYNTLTDETYTLTCATAGVSGVGQYTMQTSGETDIYGATMVAGSKGAGLTGITVEFPSGSEMTPDFRLESNSATTFVGPVEEVVTVQFAARQASPAKWAVNGSGPYSFVSAQSDKLRMSVHSVDVGGATGLNLSSPSAATTHNGGFFASLTGEEIIYTGGASATVGQGFTIATVEEFVLLVDDATVTVKTNIVDSVDATLLARYINDAASGHNSTAAADEVPLNTITLDVDLASNQDDYYNGWIVVLGNGAVTAAAGQARVITDYVGSTNVATVSANWTDGAVDDGDPYYIYNPDARSSMKGATRFNGPVVITENEFDQMTVQYHGDASTAAPISIVLAEATYASAVTLAAEVESKLATAVAAAIVAGNASINGLIIECAADSDGRLEFKVQLPGVDGSGFIQFIDADTVAEDFSVLAGFDTGATEGQGQAALVQGPIARTFECPDTGAAKNYDRMILRNRLLPGGGGSLAPWDVVGQCKLEVQTGNLKCGLTAGDLGTAGSRAVVNPATMRGFMGITGGQDAEGDPTVTLYDGTGTQPANNVFEFEMDGTPVTTTFTAVGGGTVTPLGPEGTAGSILFQIVAAMAAAPGAPFGDATAIGETNMLARIEGLGLRLTSALSSAASNITIGNGSANSALGFGASATASRTLVTPKNLSSALMSHRNSDFDTWLNVLATTTETFSKYGIASTVLDAAGAEYLYLQDAPVLVASLGSASNVSVTTPTGGVDDALRYGTGLDVVTGDGAVGESALDGYIVTSSNPAGSGSANTSMLAESAGLGEVGQDGAVGQTYRDDVTGLAFTILPRGWSSDQSGPWTAYPTGGTAIFRIRVSKTMTANSNIPQNAVPGVEMRVANTVGIEVDDTATVQTFERSGVEPAIGDLYYASYVYTKQDFTTQFFTKMSAVENAFGAGIPDNPASLGTYLSMINGAVLVGVKQVQRATGQSQASLVSYRSAVEELEGVLPGFVTPDILVPMRGDSTDLYTLIKRSCEKMSSIRYKSERTAIVGTAAGTLPADVKLMAQTLGNARMRIVYPDMAVLSIQDAVGDTTEYVVDGTFVAAALTGSVVSPNLDVATPWTGRKLVGFTQLARILDPVVMNQIAQTGVTVLETKPPFLRVRHGLTTNMANIMQKTPTVIMIADEVQRQARNVMESFIGIKFLGTVLSQVEGRLAMMFKRMVAAQIVAAYTGIKANVSSADPTVAEVEAWYSPVWPLLYLVITFHMRSSL